MSPTRNQPHRVDSIPTRSIHEAVEALENTPEWRVVQDVADLLEVGDVIAMADVPSRTPRPSTPSPVSKFSAAPPSEGSEAERAEPESAPPQLDQINQQRIDSSQRHRYPSHYSVEDAIADRAVAIVNERLRAGGNWITFDEALELARKQ